MKDYKGSENGGIAGYECDDKSIKLQFKDGRCYLYTNKKPGKKHVEEMKKLAVSGKGLTTYVNQNVRDNYEKKL